MKKYFILYYVLIEKGSYGKNRGTGIYRVLFYKI